MVSLIHTKSKMCNFPVKFSDTQVHEGNTYLNLFIGIPIYTYFKSLTSGKPSGIIAA